jgi:Transglycosylase SLT domain
MLNTFPAFQGLGAQERLGLLNQGMTLGYASQRPDIFVRQLNDVMSQAQQAGIPVGGVATGINNTANVMMNTGAAGIGNQQLQNYSSIMAGMNTPAARAGTLAPDLMSRALAGVDSAFAGNPSTMYPLINTLNRVHTKEDIRKQLGMTSKEFMDAMNNPNGQFANDVNMYIMADKAGRNWSKADSWKQILHDSPEVNAKFSMARSANQLAKGLNLPEDVSQKYQRIWSGLSGSDWWALYHQTGGTFMPGNFPASTPLSLLPGNKPNMGLVNKQAAMLSKKYGYNTELARDIAISAQEAGIPVDWWGAVGASENPRSWLKSGNVAQTSYVNGKPTAYGFMQITPGAVKQVTGQMPTTAQMEAYRINPLANAEIGARYAKWLLQQGNVHGDPRLGFASYNAGPGNIPAGMEYASTAMSLWKGSNNPLTLTSANPSNKNISPQLQNILTLQAQTGNAQLNASTLVLTTFGNLLVQLHDWFMQGAGTIEQFQNQLDPQNRGLGAGGG